MGTKEPSHADMMAELLAALELLKGYRVRVLLTVVGEGCRIRLTIPPDPAAKPPRRPGGRRGGKKAAGEPETPRGRAAPPAGPAGPAPTEQRPPRPGLTGTRPPARRKRPPVPEGAAP